MPHELTARRLATLRALVDTWVPRVSRAQDPHGLFATTGSELGVPEALWNLVMVRVAEPARGGVVQLLDALARLGFARVPPLVRERVVLRALGRLNAEAGAGLQALRKLTLFLAYGLPDASGTNRMWAGMGYPGPPRVTPPEVAPLPTVAVSAAQATLEADVVVVGSGAGGAVIAAELARTGRSVVVLEAGAQFTERTFPTDEVRALEQLYWRGGYTPAADGMLTLVAGSTLGGGTTINWMNCYPTPPWVRAEWARQHGLEGLDGPEFDAHLAAVSARIGVTDAASEDHGANALLNRAATRLGYAFRKVTRNVDPARHDPRVSGQIGYGDRSGSKLGTSRTYLADAVADGARIVVRCRVERVLVERGQAAGVCGTVDDGAGGRISFEVRAPRVVVACGSLETPALLLRSGIGGPAVGHHLRLHPGFALPALFGERVDPWMGPMQTTQVTQFLDREEGHGFTVECSHFHPGLSAALLAGDSARADKELYARATHFGVFAVRVRDRGAGRVTVDEQGEAVVRYPLGDEVDRRSVRAGLEVGMRLHEAAGADEVFDLGLVTRRWRRGQPLAPFIAALQAVPFMPGARPYFSMHQLGSARLGRDPGTSVADPNGELHTVRGVWIGDASGFPTATGANPMLTTMALARRTAAAIAASTPGHAIVAPGVRSLTAS